jgi:hypothetical protein
MTNSSAGFLQSLANMRRFEKFIHDLDKKLSKVELRNGEDLVRRASEFKVKIPEFLQGASITYDKPREMGKRFGKSEPLVLISRPDGRQQPNPPARRLFCIRIGKRTSVCLDCDWLWCKIVIVVSF